MDKILMYNKNFLLGISSVDNLRLPDLHASKECFSFVHVSIKNVFTFRFLKEHFTYCYYHLMKVR